MIPEKFLLEWTNHVPWQMDNQIEQDLIVTTILLKIYAHPHLKTTLAFRGGTALNKLFFKPPSRYSEDIDLVQTVDEPAGLTINLLREVLDPWLGPPKREFNNMLVTLIYRVTSQEDIPIKIKIEINNCEHTSVLGFQKLPFSSSSSFESGTVVVLTYFLEELLGTKLRALYQRRKGRDLYDIFVALTAFNDLNTDLVIKCFREYTRNLKQPITSPLFIANLEQKLLNSQFRSDILSLLPRQISFDYDNAFVLVREKLLLKI